MFYANSQVSEHPWLGQMPEKQRQDTNGSLACKTCRAGMPHLTGDLVGTSKVADRSALHAKFDLARPAKRSRRTQVHCSQLPRPHLDEHNEQNSGLPGLKVIAVVTALAQVVAAGEAQAWGSSWRPRRHHRRMNERSIDVKSFFQVRLSELLRMKQAPYTVPPLSPSKI